MLPNFICPGAQKCGTTTLHRILKQHPDIYLPPIKEVRFFMDAHYTSRRGKYQKFYKDYGGQRVIGDITPDYICEENAPRRILDLLGRDVKFIFMLRNPADRAFSQYRMHERSGVEKRSFPVAVADELRVLEKSPELFRYPGYIARGLYVRQIKRFMDLFDRDRTMIVVLEELIADPQQQYRDIFRFLGVNEHTEIDFSVKSNNDFEPSHKRLFAITNSIVSKTVRMLAPFMSAARLEKTRKTLYKCIIGHGHNATVKQKIDQESKRILMDYYQKDITELEKLTGRDYTIWR